MEGHTACIVGSLLVLFGGKMESKSRGHQSYSNTVRVVSDISHLVHGDRDSCLIRVMPATSPPLGRAYHTACAHRGIFMVVLGGMVERVQEQDPWMRSVDILDVDRCCWYHTDAKGDQPCSRIHHASTIHEENMFVHGGYPLVFDEKGLMKEFSSHDLLLKEENSLFDMFALNLETMIWRRITLEASVRPMVWGHSAISFGENILVLGGVDVSKQREVGDVVLWNVRRQAWQWVDCPCPIASAMHEAVVVRGESGNAEEPSHMLVFGGIQFSTQERISVLREFDLRRGTWRVVPATGELPLSRIGHSLLSYNNDTMLVIGGLISAPGESVQDTSLYIYRIKTQCWKRIALKEKEGPLKCGATYVSHRPRVGKESAAMDHNLDRLDSHGQDFGSRGRTGGDEHGVVFLQKELVRLQKENGNLRQRLQNSKPNDYYQSAAEEGNSAGGETYDAPPPLPRSAYTAVGHRHFEHEPYQMQSHGHTYRSANGNESKGSLNSPVPIIAEDAASHPASVHSFEGLTRLMNVSHFLGRGDGDVSGDCKITSDVKVVSHFSPHLIEKLVGSALGRDPPEKPPDHIANTEPSDDPFSYLRPTKAVMRWHQGASLS